MDTNRQAAVEREKDDQAYHEAGVRSVLRNTVEVTPVDDRVQLELETSSFIRYTTSDYLDAFDRGTNEDRIVNDM